jgi:hypothetical protein
MKDCICLANYCNVVTFELENLVASAKPFRFLGKMKCRFRQFAELRFISLAA